MLMLQPPLKVALVTVPEMSGTEAEFQTPLRASLPRKSQTA